MQTVDSGGLSGGASEERRHETPPQISRGAQFVIPISDILLYYEFQVFHVTSDFVELNPAFRDFQERTDKVDQVMKQLRADNVFLTLNGWRNEVCIR